MYGLKRTILFFVAASFLAGFAVDTFAQTFADPQGVRIRVNKNAEWVKIGEKFEVKVLTRGITLTTVIVSVAAPADTVGQAVDAVGDLPAATMFSASLANDGAAEGRGTLGGTDIPEFGSDDDDPKTGVTTSGIETNFTFVFPVAHGDDESAGPQSLMVQAFVIEEGQGNVYKMLHNQMTAEQESAVFSDRVGDGKSCSGSTRRRPDGTATSSTTVKIDTAALNALENTQFLANAEDEADRYNNVTFGTSPQELYLPRRSRGTGLPSR